MRFRTIAVACAAVTLTGAPSSSGAQTVRPLGILIRAGVFWPTSGEAKALGKQWFTAGAELRLFKLRLGLIAPGYESSVTLSIDTYNKGGASSVPILLNYVGRFDKIHYGLGAGISIAERPGFDTATELAYQLSLGHNFPYAGTGLTVELRWFSVADVGSSLDGFALTLGIRL